MSLDGLDAATGGSGSAREPCSTTKSGFAAAAGLGAVAARGEGAATLGPVEAGRGVGVGVARAARAARAAGAAGAGATTATNGSVRFAAAAAWPFARAGFSAQRFSSFSISLV